MPADVTTRYSALGAANEIERDRSQETVAGMLAMLDARLSHHRLARKSSSLGWLFGARERAEAAGYVPCTSCRPDLHPLPA